MTKHFLSCDWGTSHFRLRWVECETGAVLARFESDRGAARIAESVAAEHRADAYRKTLMQGIEQLTDQSGEDLHALPTIISGMASSSIGWRELPYTPLPFALDGGNCTWHNLAEDHSELPRAGVFLLSGARSQNDVMRGEETEVVGVARLLARNPLLDDCLVILPGTHSKHVRLSEGQIVDFQTAMTGELFDVLGSHSVLRHSLPRPPESPGPVDLETLRQGVETARTLSLPAALFRVRTRQLLAGCDPGSGASFLSGVLIGAELVALTAPDRHNVPIVLAAGQRLHDAYHAACGVLGLLDRLTIVPSEDVARLSVLGHCVVLDQLIPSA
jgi:2-dehydro-3-deoxygalactonokinase